MQTSHRSTHQLVFRIRIDLNSEYPEVAAKVAQTLESRASTDPNAPSGASTAAPYFVDRRLFQLSAFCSLQNLDRSFDLCVFVCVCLSRDSAVIGMFFTFSVISFRARRLWHPANAAAEKQPKSFKNDAQIHEHSSQIHLKSTKMMPRSVPKAISELAQQKGGHIKRKISSFLLIMLIFGHFWGPLKNRGCAKNDPKNSIRLLLGTTGRPNG